MYHKFDRALRNLHRGQRGVTGLETAIILIAFITVASVLAYSVLSAGIYSAERGKETVYIGLEAAQNTLAIKGSVLGLSSNQTKLENIQFNITLMVPNVKVDTQDLIFNYYDNKVHQEGLSANITLATGCNERGAVGMLEGDEIHLVKVTIPTSANCSAYTAFSLQIIPPAGATVTIHRTLPGALNKVMDLQ